MKTRFGFLLFNGLEELDLVGPWEMISLWNKEYHGPEEIVTISETGNTITCAKNLQIIPTHSFSSCPHLDYLLIPGGKGTRHEVNNKNLIQFIKRQATTCKNILSVCTGSFLLHAAGLLEDRKATTHWLALEKLKEIKSIHVIEERYTKDKSIWTSAGVSAGIDMALAFIAETAGNEVAGKVQLHAEYFPENKRYLKLDKILNLPAYLKDLV